MKSYFNLKKTISKKYSEDVSLFALLGSVFVKAAHKMLMKLAPGFV